MSFITKPSTAKTLYLRGTFNDWGNDTPLCYLGNNQYLAIICLVKDKHRFKISDIDGSEEFTFSADKQKETSCYLNQSLALIPAKGIGNDLIFHPDKTALYQLALDLIDPLAPNLTISLSEENKGIAPNRPLLAVKQKVTPSPKLALKAKSQPILSPEALFQVLAIKETSAFSFVFGDNLDGYYEGKTHTTIAAGKYRHKQAWYFAGFNSVIKGQFFDKTKAYEAALYPYGVSHHYQAKHIENTEGKVTEVKDTLSLFSANRMIGIQVCSDTKTKLGALLSLNLAIDQCTVSVIDDYIVYALAPEICQPDSPRFIAIGADKPYQFKELGTNHHLDASLELDNLMHLSHAQVKPLIESLQPSQEMTIYIAFAMSESSAVSKVAEACESNGFIKHCQASYEMLTKSYFWSSDERYNQALMWAKASSQVFVSEEYGTGIWAGLPWFKDCWGRDSFIALPGITLVNGHFDKAKKIITNFAAMQLKDKENSNYGRIPNRVSSADNIIYNTTDGTPWMVREIGEYLRYSGDLAFAADIYPCVQAYIEGVEKHHYSNGLMTHRHPDTWMDAKWQGEIPWSARGNRANDIQALWFTSLEVAANVAALVGDKAGEQKYSAMAAKAKQEFEQLFWDQNKNQLADRIDENGKADFSMRPNQLMALSIPLKQDFIKPEIGAHLVKNAVSELLFPWGICSLSQHDPWFHPYHNGRDEYHKDAAYHNGTIWGWNAGFTVSALLQYGEKELAYQLTQNLAEQLLTLGHRGTMSENLDAFLNTKGELVTSGTYAQAWSVSEFNRNAYQDYLGFRPDLLNNQIVLIPQFPASWERAQAIVPFGTHHSFSLLFEKQDDELVYQIESSQESIKLIFGFDNLKGERQLYHLLLKDKASIKVKPKTGELLFNNKKVLSNAENVNNGVDFNGEKISPVTVTSLHKNIIGSLSFAKPNKAQDIAVLKQNQLLETEILSKAYPSHQD